MSAPQRTPPDGGRLPVIAYALHDGAGGLLAARDADRVFYSASVIKLAVMLAAMRAVDAGDVDPDERLECARRFTSGVDAPEFSVAPADSDPRYPREGMSASVTDLVTMMISRSSNEATNVILGRIGLDAVGQALRLCGATHSRMQRRFGDDAAADAGLTNEVTAHDAATIMRCIVAGEFTAAGTTQFMRTVLRRQEHPRIGTIVPAGTMWGSKAGDVPGIEHDVAFVGDPTTPATLATTATLARVRYLAVCTSGFAPAQGREAIVATASALLSDRRSDAG